MVQHRSYAGPCGTLQVCGITYLTFGSGFVFGDSFNQPVGQLHVGNTHLTFTKHDIKLRTDLLAFVPLQNDASNDVIVTFLLFGV